MTFRPLSGVKTSLTKPLTRLIEVVSSGIGAVFRPYLIKRDADAHAYEANKLSETLKGIAEKQNLPVVYKNGPVEMWQKPEDSTLILSQVDLTDRCSNRIDYQERKKQENIEKITATAANELAHETDVPNEPPEEDWITRFFNCAQDISSDEMQELWGRILSGEIKKPGSYSLRTLEFIKNLTKKEAHTFEQVAKLAIQIPGDTWVVIVHNKTWLKDNRQIFPMHQFLLGELGVMYPSDLSFNAFEDSKTTEIALFSDAHLLLLKRGEIKTKVQIPIWKFTGIGKELLSLTQKPLDEQYFNYIGKFFIQKKGKALIAKIKSRLPDGRVAYDIAKEIKIEPASEPDGKGLLFLKD
ncbi:DUF2806 domain-containing protein [Desulfobacula toluolica]|uniref:Conserved uncharacterized protein n=1 Tax=Desulfobacula toluolica (strain DSM 7467 / Tol2) TaxID=651182 RepID=K0NAS2_DESTT|nr:DUF2806 domain-containing protein [Desulfobacula toluolica]CCK81254.1 conserved uncharacterized protein [Desulfobacula toluolica Tol2]